MSSTHPLVLPFFILGGKMETKEIFINIFFFLGVFLVVYVFTYFMNLHKLNKKKEKSIGELNYLLLKFRLKKSKLKVRKMLLWFSLIDAFIIAFVTTFITVLNVDTLWQMLIGFVLLFGLIYSLYEIYGRHLVNAEKRRGE